MSQPTDPAMDRVAELLGQYIEAYLVDGTALDPEALCHESPELAETLREHIQDYHRLERSLAPTGELEPGHQLLHFHILEKLGEGGMGEVYMAEDTKLGRRVALKVLPTKMADDPERLARFRREARALAATSHANIVTVHSVEEADGLHFLTMELVEGDTLRQLIPADGMALDRLLSIALGATAALAAAHRRGITHRDLKPDNIMVDADGHVRVLDFGLAKKAVKAPLGASRQAITETLTGAGRVLGTLPYMSPEQLLAEPVDPRSDIFSFGVILFEMATGRRPFGSDKPAELISAILRDMPEEIHTLREDLPSRLGRIVRRCLEKEPASRFQTARELHHALTELGKEWTPAPSTLALSTLAPSTLALSALAPSTLVAESGDPRGVDSSLDTSPTNRAEPAGRSRWLRPTLALLAVLGVGSMQWLRSPGETSTADLRPAGLRPAGLRPAAAVESAMPVMQAEVPDRRSVAVLLFENLTGDPELSWLRHGLAELVVIDLSRSSKLEVLGMGRLHQILKQFDALNGTPSFEVIQNVAEEGGSEVVIRGSFALLGDMLRLAFTIEDADSGTVLESDYFEGQGVEAVFALVNQLSASIHGNLVSAPSPTQRSTIQAVTTGSLAAWQLYSQGTELYLNAQHAEAIEMLERAVAIDPTFALAFADLGTIHRNLGHSNQAREYTGRALELSERLPADLRYRIEAGYFGARWTSLDRAIEAYEELLKLDPEIDNLRNNLARRYAFLERYEDAIREFEFLIAGDTPVHDIYLDAANAYAASGDFATGHRLIADFVGRHPDNWLAHLGLGWHLTEWGKLDEAVAVIDEAAELWPGETFVHYPRWRLAVRREDWPLAERAAKTLGSADDNLLRWRSAVSQARNHLYLGRARQALASFDRAARVANKPDAFSALARCWKAELHGQLDEWQLAVADAAKAQQSGAGEWPELLAIFLAAQGELQLGRSEEAAERVLDLRRRWGQRPNRVEERQLAQLEGLMALAQGDIEPALTALHRAAALLPANGVEFHWHVYPQHVTIWYDLARTELAAGHDERARPWLERIVASGSEHLEQPVPYVRSFYLLAEIHRRAGNVPAARSNYERFLVFWRDGDLDRPWVEVALAEVRDS